MKKAFAWLVVLLTVVCAVPLFVGGLIIVWAIEEIGK